ncbi:winged helix-turn-helix transcriptional regulator [Schaalia sp. lx-100]|uniref:winged helix-turn-helix transcriptional regulator n=1 Tax=Schaalia sp. lx-100 TaxID=2899081 RepID=UPI001E60470A|nr:helix-turn-helix domain-containing protein [Schaalia sp. lx-100]MCD4557947.1 helix-turn-helix transcriptional regulator [Schaalia sp. lx-100]
MSTCRTQSETEADGDILNADCPSRTVLRHVTDRWAPMIITVLSQENTVRFTQLKDFIGGISGKVLTETLRSMERDGLIHREVIPTIPPRVNYSLTNLGHSVVEPIQALRRWAEKHVTIIEQHREKYDAQTVK